MTAFIYYYVMVLGNTLGSHVSFLDRLMISQKQREVYLVKDSDVIIAFVPVVSRAGTDIAAAMKQIPQNKHVVLVVLHHTTDPYHPTPDSRSVVDTERVFAVDCLFHEDYGLLNCLRNDEAIRAVKNNLNVEENTENNFYDICAKMEQYGVSHKLIFAVGIIFLLIISIIILFFVLK